MSSVSALDREMAYLDVHGIPPNFSQIETPELVQKSLVQLQIREALGLAV